MSERDELIDQLRYRPVATTAAQMRKAASLLERDGARIAELEAEVARLTRELSRVSDQRDSAETLFSAKDAEIGRLRARAEAAEAKLAALPTDWQQDSSLETWFPISAQALREAEIDAGRYRWLRDCWFIAGEEFPPELNEGAASSAHFDDAIDAAIAQKEGM